MAEGKWITPFKKQCFVVVGASINMSQIGMVMGVATSLLPQLRASAIIADAAAGSWVAALPGFGLILGNVTIPTLMVKYGRRKANLISIIIVILGWACLVAANSIPVILAGRLLQGVSIGMSSCLVPILIGEYTSPNNRGPFTIVMSLIMATGTLTVHAVGSYATWEVTAFVCTVVSFIDFLMVLFSPETPSWLSDQGRYTDCEHAFHWLRGNEEEEELTKMIKTSKETRKKTKGKVFRQFLFTAVKKEFYKPIVIMVHLHAMGQWAGINLLSPYIINLVEILAGKDVNAAAVMISIDIQRMVSCVLAVFIIRRVKRRSMLFVTVGLNCLTLVAIAGYGYAKEITQFGHPAWGVLLLHLLMMTVAVGSLPLPFAIAGEIFPLRYKGLSGGISSLFCSINIFLAVKTYPFLETAIGLDGACCLYAGILVYCLVVVWFLLPETKDRTLQEIEEEFKRQIMTEDEIRTAQPFNASREDA